MSDALPLDGDRLAAPSFLDDPGVRRIFALLDRDGEEARVVGGAVRNALLREPVHEVDFTTTAAPDEVIRRARAAKLRCVPTGIDHGTVTILVDGTSFEITTLREDVETDGRRARVRFGRSFERDALRRDFTINALSVDATHRVFDYTGGLDDLRARRVRFIGDARTRIREDYLRILRFFRFHAAYSNGPMDAEAFQAAIAERDGLSILSRERIRAELIKLVVGRRAAAVLDDVAGTGLLLPITGGIAYPTRLARLGTLENEADAERRWIAAFVAVPEDAERLRERLRLSNAETERAIAASRVAAALHGRDAPPLHGELREILFHHARRAALDGLMLAWASSTAGPQDPHWRAASAFLRDTPEPRLPFSGADLLARGVPPGREMGRVLKRLQADWIRAGFPKDPTDLARLLESAVRQA